jgi:hypothetical protein
MTEREDDRPITLEGVPYDEDISVADAAERLELDPEEQTNKAEIDPARDG